MVEALPPRQIRGALAVVGGLTEEGAVEHRPAEPEVEVVLPGEADAAVQLGCHPHGPVVHIRQVRLGDGGVSLGRTSMTTFGKGVSVPVTLGAPGDGRWNCTSTDER